MRRPEFDIDNCIFTRIKVPQPSAEEKLAIVGLLPQHLLSTPDQEEISILIEEALKLGERLRRITIAIQNSPHGDSRLSNALGHLKVDLDDLKFYLEASRGT